MAGNYELVLEPEEMDFVRRAIKAIMKEVQKLDLDVDAETLAQRTVDAINNGERNFARLRALVMGPEAAAVFAATDSLLARGAYARKDSCELAVITPRCRRRREPT